MIKKIVPVLLLGMVMTLAAHRAEAGLTYQATDLHTAGVTAGERWKYKYHIDGPFSAGHSFVLIYGASIYGSLNLLVPLDNLLWDQSSLSQPDPFNTLDGLLTSIARLDIADASADFEVAFDWTGPGRPGSQAFQLRDAIDNLVLNSSTSLNGAGVPVPEPATLPLVLAGLLLIRRNIKRRLLQHVSN